MRQLVQLRRTVQLRMVFEQWLLNVAAVLPARTSYGHISASAALLFPQNLNWMAHGLGLSMARCRRVIELNICFRRCTA